jgi:hypothetical protein
VSRNGGFQDCSCGFTSDLFQVDEPCNAQTVKLSSKSLIEKWGLRELVVCLEWIDVPKMVLYE